MKEAYKNRRQELLKEKKGPCLICIFSGSAPMKSLDEAYPFYVDRNFYYLTGIERENMILVLHKDYSGTTSETLYIEPYDEASAKVVGGRMKSEEATAISGVETVPDCHLFEEDLNTLIRNSRGLGDFNLYVDLWRYHKDQPHTPAHILAARIREYYPAVKVNDIYSDMSALRSVKTADELVFMRKAQEATRIAIEDLLRHAAPGMNESELEGAFDFSLMKQGVRQHAFSSIVAGGINATILHYSQNNCIVNDGDLVLLDLGASVGNYCADISRTFPISGTFTKRQKEIYNTVLDAQNFIISSIKPGLTLRQLNEMVISFYESRLPDLGLAKNGKSVRDYYYHTVSHSLGLDCHDICTERDRTLRPGMVITVEPGFYIEEESIGIRIENNVLITEDGCIDLSSDILRTVDEIEAFMAK